jgi:hypothetical protein
MSPEEIAIAIQAFLELEPEIQRGIVSLLHLIQKSKPGSPPAPMPQAAPGE